MSETAGTIPAAMTPTAGSATPSGPQAAYQRLLQSGEISEDPRQAEVVERLDALAHELKTYQPPARTQPRGGLFARLGNRAPSTAEVPMGLYLHGDVGRGKSMLMDLFFNHTPVQAKRRAHFHEFMLDTHQRLHALRQQPGIDDALVTVADQLADAHHLLCFDEFLVTNIADAMILARLFEAMFKRGVIVVATSNFPPKRLYEGGLNRDRFVPFIDILLAHVEVMALAGPVDYRLSHLSDVPAYHTPLGPATDAKLDRIFAILAQGDPGQPERLAIGARHLDVPKAAEGVAVFDFNDLCAQPLGAADYLALTERYHSIILKNLPRLTPDKRNEARRFITLVDALYERRTMLFITADVPPDQLYASGDGAFEFQRTTSRLAEMQSQTYLNACRTRPSPETFKHFQPFALTSDLI